MELRYIETRLARAATLPILPNVVTQVLALSDNPTASTRDYERVIAQDTALAAKILRTANSSYYCGNGQITTLHRALTHLGVNAVRSISVTVAFHSLLNARGLSRRFPVARFWQHSMAVACGAKLLACLTRYPQPEEAFLAGLVHDIGKLAMWLFLPDEADAVLAQMAADVLTQYDAEMLCLGCTHQEVGRMAAERWGLPPVFLRPIAEHHFPIEEWGSLDDLTAFVHVANALAHEIGLDETPCAESSAIQPYVTLYLGLPEAQYEPLKNALVREVSRLAEQMRLV